MDNVKKFFESHPTEDIVFETSDNLLFRQDGDAALHAKDLKAKNVTTHLREVVMSEAEVATMAVIDKIETHTDVDPAGQDGKTITAQEIQIPVTPAVKEQLQNAEKATGDIVTNTAVDTVVKTPDTEVKAVTTATGETAANAPAKPMTKAEKDAAKAAAAAGK